MKYFFWIILFFSEQLFPKNVFIAGKVTDSQNKNPLASANVLLYPEFVLRSEFNHTFDGGISDEYNPNTYLLNLSLGKKFFADNSGELKLSVYDALNQNKNVSRESTDYYTQEYSLNIVGRCYLLSFIYNIRTFN